MGRAKDIEVRPIAATDARRLVRQWHYSGKVVNNSQVHLGCYLDGECGGVMQYGPPMTPRAMLPLVAGTRWGEAIELNRMAFADHLPRNAESRCIAVAMRLLRKQYPRIKWVLSFADATQCGDGTIYRASGFVLTAIKPNTGIWRLPNGECVHTATLTSGANGGMAIQRRVGKRFDETPTRFLKRVGADRMQGFQLRYIYFLHPEERANLTVPELPYSAIAEAGAGMYKGQKRERPPDRGASEPTGAGGASPTRTLQEVQAEAVT